SRAATCACVARRARISRIHSVRSSSRWLMVRHPGVMTGPVPRTRHFNLGETRHFHVGLTHDHAFGMRSVNSSPHACRVVDVPYVDGQAHQEKPRRPRTANRVTGIEREPSPNTTRGARPGASLRGCWRAPRYKPTSVQRVAATPAYMRCLAEGNS